MIENLLRWKAACSVWCHLVGILFLNVHTLFVPFFVNLVGIKLILE